MTFEDFSIKFKEELLTKLAEKYPDYKVDFHDVPKQNQLLHGISIMPKNSTNSPNYGSTFYFEYIYDNHDVKNLLTLGNLVDNFLQYWQNTKKSPDNAARVIESMTKETVLSNCFPYAISRDLNRELIDICISTNLLDLSVLYRVFLYDNKNEGYFHSALVTKGMLELYDISEDALMKAAYDNVPKLFKPIHKSSITPNDPISPVFDLTNNLNSYASMYLVNTEELAKAARQFNRNLCIMPRSVDIFSYRPITTTSEIKECRKMVREYNYKISQYFKNKKESNPDYLSNNVYIFDKNTGEITTFYK